MNIVLQEKNMIADIPLYLGVFSIFGLLAWSVYVIGSIHKKGAYCGELGYMDYPYSYTPEMNDIKE